MSGIGLEAPSKLTQRGRHLRQNQIGALGGSHRVVFLVSFGVALLYVLYLHGYLPGMSEVPLAALFGTGAIQCLHDQGVSSLWTWCMSLGLPIGAPRLTGLPQVYLGWLFSYIPGLGARGAHQLTAFLFDALAFFGAYRLLRRWEIPRWISLLSTVSFLTAVNVLILNGFPYTLTGYLLLPASTYAALWTLDRLDEGKLSKAVVGVVAVSLLMVFTDGYAFFGSALVICCFVLAWVVRGWSKRGPGRSVRGGLLWFSALAGSALLYALWVPKGAYETHVDLELFGLLGVDLATLVVPSNRFVFPRLLGLDVPELATWGIRDTPPTNYLGFLTLAVVIGYATRLGRGRSAGSHVRELIILGVAGLVALILSLGPTLKIGQLQPGLDASILTLPTAWLYENVPGVSEMRAANRWLIVTRMALVFIGAAGLSALWTRWRGPSLLRGTLIVVLAAFMALETMPNLWNVVSERRRSTALIQFLNEGILAEADELLLDDEIVLVLPSVNDFLANYLVPMTGTKSYNVGGDKNYRLSVSEWPTAVIAARADYGLDAGDSFCRALTADTDAIVLPYMSPFSGPLLRSLPIRPLDMDAEGRRRIVALELADDPRFDAESGDWLTVLRGSGANCTNE
jgi:hypothetical protein